MPNCLAALRLPRQPLRIDFNTLPGIDLVTHCVRSMTGQGHASAHGDLGSVNVEVRTINNRGFKCSPRLSDSLNTLENKIESLARSMIHRGTVHLTIVYRGPASEQMPELDQEVLQAYVDQLQRVSDQTTGEGIQIDLASLLPLPGVIVNSTGPTDDLDQIWEFVRETIVMAIENLNLMRDSEGARMADSLKSDCQLIDEHLQTIEQLAPRSADTYRQRLQGKVSRMLADHDLHTDPIDLLREVQIYADKVDISEEVTRLRSHLTMFLDILGGQPTVGKEVAVGSPTGRKLDFTIQEMFREINTTGSKASDAEISAHVVEIKCAIERMRELVQNLE